MALYTVGTDPAKDVLFGRLLSPMMHFNMSCNEDYFLQLTAEKAVTKMSRGFEYREWQKIRPRNEILDLWVYALATLYILNPVWEALGNETEKTPEPKQSTPAEQQRGDYMNQLRRQQRRGGFVKRW